MIPPGRVVTTPGWRRPEREVKDMWFHSGKWHYQGKVFNSLHDALVALWPR